MNRLMVVSFLCVFLVYMLWLLIKKYLYLTSVPRLIALSYGKLIFVKEYLTEKLSNGMFFYVLSILIALIPLTKIISFGKAFLMGSTPPNPSAKPFIPLIFTLFPSRKQCGQDLLYKVEVFY
ncbi:hypothetical protein CRYUN_Cryun28dG0002100 [Craigia yunnanensis]